MAETKPLPVGAWVRFMRGGVLVVGVVEYAKKAEHYWQGCAVYTTTVGEIDHASVLEVREQKS